MASLEEYRSERLKKLNDLQDLGIDVFPPSSRRTTDNQKITDDFDKLEGSEVFVVGRIVRIRSFGKLAFIVIKDLSGEIQLYLKDSDMSELDASSGVLGIKQIALLDTGDFVQADGKIVKTEKGEISVLVKNLKILSKALRPLPLSHEAFTNKEERFRRRYVDTNVNRDVLDRYVRRSKFWQANRNFLISNGFLEINIPVLEHTTGGADAKPFLTHMDALDQDFYLRISHELPLKKLIGGGYERVFDIGARFRNEDYTEEHLPEHVAMEWYWAYADWQDGMKLMSEMFAKVLLETFGKTKFVLGEHEVDMEKTWEEIDYAQIVKSTYGIDPYDTSIDQVKRALQKNQLIVEETDNIVRGIDKLWKQTRKSISGPAWLVNIPEFMSPLAKKNPAKPGSVQRYQAVIGGTELGNGWSELNDPIDQLERFKTQQQMRKAGDEEAQMLDIDYVEMLEYGMPPTCGWGHSERLFWTFEGVTAREGVPFPHLKTEVSDTTRAIYPDLEL